jgi:hypothetical protein
MQRSALTEQEQDSKKALIDLFEKALLEVGSDPMSKPDLSTWLGLKT